MLYRKGLTVSVKTSRFTELNDSKSSQTNGRVVAILEAFLFFQLFLAQGRVLSDLLEQRKRYTSLFRLFDTRSMCDINRPAHLE